MPIETDASIRWCPACLAIYRAAFARCPIDGDVLEVGHRDPLIGMTIAQHYVIDEFLGEGAMARVYRAHHALLAQKRFAIKVMIGDLAATLEMRLRFAQEADAASQLEHPNVVSVVDFGRSESGLMFIAMELVDGRSLADVIAREGALSARRVVVLARQICQGLAHAHERGLVHRDLKPDNIVITGRDRVRIVDFGLAIPMDDERSTRLTGVGLAMGTPIYASPEQTCAEAVDHRADLFALGVTMFEMLAGKPPFDGGLVEIIAQNASDRMPSISERAGKRVPQALEDIVRRLMRRDPADRFPDATAVLAALDATHLAPGRLVSLPLTPVPQRRWRDTVIGVALFALIAGAGGLASLADDDAPPAASAAVEARSKSDDVSTSVAAIASDDEPPPAPIVEEPPPAPPTKKRARSRRVRVVARPTATTRETRPVASPKKPAAHAASNRDVRDEEFYGGPTSFSRLPDPVDATAAKAAAANVVPAQPVPNRGEKPTDTPF
ncbi:MAG: serine/threonine-protein kinase [Kofleriaceae bacterium]